MQVKKTRMCQSILFLAIVVFSLSFFNGKAEGYNEKSMTVSRNWYLPEEARSTWPTEMTGDLEFYDVLGLSINATHQVGMTVGSYKVKINDPINFAYNPVLTFNDFGITYDTPYGFWIGDNSPSCSIAKLYASAYSLSLSYFIRQTENLSEDAIIHSLSVFSQTPSVSMQSNNSEIISCTGMNCVAKKSGSARLTAVINVFPTGIFYLRKSLLNGTSCSGYSVSPDLSQGTAGQLYWDISVSANPPSDPVISGPTSGGPNTLYSFSAVSTDPDGNNIKYNVRLGSDTTVWRTTSFAASGVLQLLGNDFSWSENGVQTFSVQAQDSNGDVSNWVTYSINIGNQPPTAPVITGPTTGIINTPYTFNVVSNDLDGDQVEYLVWWEGECSAREILPNCMTGYEVCSGIYSYMWSKNVDKSTCWADSGVAQTTTGNQWATAGSKILHVLARDTHLGVSAESTFTIAINSTLVYSCTGTDPSNAEICVDDSLNLTADTVKKLVSSCGTAKCEYICNNGYHYESGYCVENTDPVLTSSPGICGNAIEQSYCQVPPRDRLCYSSVVSSLPDLNSDN